MLLLLQILAKPHTYYEVVKTQNMFNCTNSCNKFKIEGRATKQQEKDFEEHTRYMDIPDIIKRYNL